VVRFRWQLGAVAISAGLIVPAVIAAQSDSTTTRLPPVVVTVTRGSGQSILGSPFALTIVQPDSLRPGQRHTAIDETLALVPGLTVTNRNNPSQDPRLSIRGFGARSTFGVRGVKILRDGMPLTLPDGQTPLDYLSLESVGRVEIMRGAASALYGNASGGVIDLRSAPPPSTPISGKITQWLGDSRFAKTSLTAAGSSGNEFYQGDASFERSDGPRAHSRQRQTNGFARAGTTLGETQLALTVLALDNPLALNPGALTIDQLRTDPSIADAQSVQKDARKAARQIQAGLSATHPLGSGDINASVFEGARTLDNPLTFGIVEIGRHTYGASARATQTVTGMGLENRFVVGTDLQSQNDLRRNYTNCADTIPLAAPTATCPSITEERGSVTLDQRELVSSAGAYASDDIGVGSRVGITAGIRADDIRFQVKDRLINATNPDDSGRRSMSAVTPVLAAVFRIAPTHSLYANVAGAFETPTATELGNHPDGSAGINQDLNPQRSTTTEIGAKGFAGALLNYDVAVYQTGVRDELIPFEIPNSNGRRYFRNAGHTTRKGAELGARVSEGFASLIGSYTFSSYHFDSYRTGASVYDGNVIPGVPRNRWQLSATASGTPGFATLETEGATSVFLDDANSVTGPAYVVSNVRAGTQISVARSRLSVAAGVQNIFDRHYAASVAINAARGKFFEPAVTRSFYVSMSVSVPSAQR
jgi:iron complex outermembrane receptor protein